MFLFKRLYIVLFLIPLTISAQDIDHSIWNSLLKKYVSVNGNVHYNGFKTDLNELDTYIANLSNYKIEQFNSKKEKLAFWINAYNALTIRLIVEHYPLKSIKDIEQPWDKEIFRYGNQFLTLNYIEHEILRKMNEPRIHFAINCASVSCPKLLNEAYFGDTIELQLMKATKEFLNSDKNFITNQKVELSKIFKWFRKDFQENGTLIDFINTYSRIRVSQNAKVKFKDYNWSLNE